MKTEQAMTDFINHIKDPLLQLTLTEMGINPDIQFSGRDIQIQLETGFPAGFLNDSFIPLLQSKLHEAKPDYTLDVCINQKIKPHRTQLPGKGLRHVKNVVAIASGKGGVGKSTVAVNLATALAAAGARVGLLDADIYGPSIPMMLGEAKPIEICDDHYLPIAIHGIQAMSIGYLTSGNDALIWRGPMLAKSLIHMLDATRWDDLDYLFIDLPPGTGDIQLSLVQKIPLTGAVVVTTPQQIATLDAQKAIHMFAKTNIDTLGVIENMSYYICKHCGEHDQVFGHGGAQRLANEFGCLLLGQLPFDPRIITECDQGTPSALNQSSELSGTLMNIALRTAIEISKRPLNYADKFPPIVAG